MESLVRKSFGIVQTVLGLSALLRVLSPGGAVAQGVTFAPGNYTNQPGETVTVSMSVTGFTYVGVAQFTLLWDTNVLQYVSLGNFNLNGLAGGNFGVFTNTGQLTLSWDDPSGSGTTVADGTVIFTLSFLVLGSAGSSSSLALVDAPTPREVDDGDLNPLNFISVNGQVQVASRAAPVINAWPTASALTYGQALAASALSGGSASVDGSFSFDSPATVPPAGAYAASVTFTPTDMVNYLPVSGSVNVAVAQAPLTVTGITASDKVYDGTTTATIQAASAALVGNLDGANVVLSTAGASGVFTPDGSVGNGKTVQVSGLSISGSASSNYTLTEPTATASITAKPLTVTGITASDKVYDGTATAMIQTGSAALVGNLDGANVVLSTAGASGAFTPDGSVGNGKTVQVSGLSISGSASSNYTLTEPTATANITAKALTVTGITASDKVYDGTTVATIQTGGAALVGNLDGANVVLSTAGASGLFTPDGSVGNGKTVQVSGLSISGSASSNYTLTEPTTIANITAKTLTVTGITASDKVYDGTTAATIQTGGAALVGNLDGANVVLSTAGASGAFTPDGSVGNGKTVQVSGLSISGSASSNYTLTEPTTIANITAKALTVTGITASDKVYDGTTTATIHTGSAALAGKVTGDNVTLITTGAIGTFADANVGMNKTVYVSGLTISGADIGNYTLTQPTTTASILQGGLVLTVVGIEAQNKVYDGTNNATLIVSNAVLVGVVGEDNVTLDTTNAVGAFADENVGAGKTVAVSGLALLGPDAGKYTLTQPAGLVADITPLGITGNFTAQNKIYDGNNTAVILTRTLAGVLPADQANVSLTGGTATFDDEQTGSGKTVTLTGATLGGTAAVNYALTSVGTTLADISKAAPSVTAWPTASAISYGQTLAASTLSGGSATPAGSFAFTTPSMLPNAGTGMQSVTYTPTDTFDYNTASSTVSVTVNPASSTTVLASSQNPSLLGSNVIFTATVSSSAGTPTGAVVFKANTVPFSTNALAGGIAVASTSTLPAGTNTVTAEYDAQGNYSGSTTSLAQVVRAIQTPSTIGITNNGYGSVTVTFSGTPGAQYVVQAKSALGSATPWVNVSTNEAGSKGNWTFVDSMGTNTLRFYRSATP